MARVAFKLHDPDSSETYNMEINPNDSGTPTMRNTYNYQTPTAGTNGPIISQGVRELRKLDYSGTLLTENQYNQMLLFSAREYPWHITDDLGRKFAVMCESFEPKRIPSISHPWRHDYTWNLIVIKAF